MWVNIVYRSIAVQQFGINMGYILFCLSRSLMATVELIQTNAKDLGELQRKMDSWHAQGLDEREIMARSKDEQLRSKCFINLKDSDIIAVNIFSNSCHQYVCYLLTVLYYG